MHSSRWVLVGCLSFLGGVATGAFQIQFHPFLEIIMLGALACMMFLFLTGKNILVLMIVSMVVLFVGFGIWRMESAMEKTNEYAELVGQNLEFEGLVTYVDKRVEQALVNIKMDGKKAHIQFRMSPKTTVAYGDRVWVRGKIQMPKSSQDFDYEKFLKSRNVDAIGYYPKMVTLKSGQGNKVLSTLLTWKAYISRKLGQVYQGRVFAILSGILLGSREGIDKSLGETFSSAGLSHILVASGYNLTVLVGSISSLIYLFGRRRLQVLAAILVFAFVGMTGAASSILRAGIMAMILILSRVWGRQYSSGGAVVLAASLMVLLNPYILLWDAGFQLSFAATCGIIFLAPMLDDYFAKLSNINFLRENFSVSMAAVLSTLPIISFHFDRIQLLSLLSNIIVVPFVPVLMLLGILGLCPLIGGLFARLAIFLSYYVLEVASSVAGIRIANLNMHLSALGVAAYYILILIIYYLISANNQARQRGL